MLSINDTPRMRAAFAGFVIQEAAVSYASHHPGRRRPTAADRAALETMLAARGQAALLAEPPRGFIQQVAAVLAIQDAVLTAATVNEGIPLGKTREPAALLRYHKGLCYDRSRAIEKALALLGLETRHVAVYAIAPGSSALDALLTPGVSSHALSEVRTDKGWMLVDSNHRWISLSAAGQPVSIARLAAEGTASFAWAPQVPAKPKRIFSAPFTWLYGLYSRHGRFYPPMDSVPDVNWPQLLANLG